MTSSLRHLLFKNIRLGNRSLVQHQLPFHHRKSILVTSHLSNVTQKEYSFQANPIRSNSQMLKTPTPPSTEGHEDTLSAMEGLLLKASPSCQTPRSIIIRHLPGEERFQMKLIHKNRVFNFDRSLSDTIQSLMERMVTNITKKMKTFDGAVTLLTRSLKDEIFSVPDTSLNISTLLQEISAGSCQLHIKISEEIYDVVVNPPEVLSIKFLKQAVVGFPIIPYKIETSSNFDRDASQYLWEFTKEAKKPMGTVPKKKSQQVNNGMTNSRGLEKGWMSTGCTEYIFTPGQEVLGSRLRLTCIPSNSNGFGLPFSEEVPETVSPFPVDKPLFTERVERIRKKVEEETIRPMSDLNHFRFVTYNCLAECYATEEWFISSPKSALPAEFRLPFLCQEFANYQGDVYCLQEIEDKYFERIFTPFFECTMGYKGFFSPKTGNVKEGVAMFYNPRKLTSIRNETVVILEHLMTMPIWNKIPDSIVKRISERNSVLQVSIFKAASQENTIIIIANTHLYFHPDADHVRMLQTASCIDFIETVASELKKNYEGIRVGVMFCGDFNCTPPFSSFRYLTSGVIQEDDFDWTSHPTEKLKPGLSLQHGLQLTNSHPQHELTNITTCFEGCIDYILYQSQNFDLVETYPPPGKDTLATLCNLSETRLVSLPNLYTPSDHLPLIADFKLKPKSD